MSASLQPVLDGAAAVYRLQFDQSLFLDNEIRYHMQTFEGQPRSDTSLKGGLELMEKMLANVDRALILAPSIAPLLASGSAAVEEGRRVEKSMAHTQEQLDSNLASLQVEYQKAERQEEKAIAEGLRKIDDSFAERRLALLDEFKEVTPTGEKLNT